MTRYRTYYLLLLALLLLVAPSAAIAQEAPTPAAAASAQPTTLLVGVEKGLSEEQVAQQLSAAGLEMIRYWERFGVAEALAPAQDAERAMAASVEQQSAFIAAANPQFRYVETDQPVYAASTLQVVEPPLQEPEPNDPRFVSNEQYAIDKVQAIEAWNITHGNSDVVIGVIDSGYEADHPDLVDANIWANEAEVNGVAGVDDDGNGYIDDFHGWDWYTLYYGDEGDNDPNDTYGHGTHVLGTIAAATNNGIGISNVGSNVSVAVLKMLGDRGQGTTSGLINAIDYAIDMDMDVVNMSLTASPEPSPSTGLKDAIIAAHDAGVIVVAAAGNQNSNVKWPAAYVEAVAVAATNSSDDRWVSSFDSGSNYGPEIDIAAPGQNVLSTYKGGYATQTGTSMATPHVSALFGLLRSLRPDLTGDELLAIMKNTSDDVNSSTYPGDDIYLGAGRINYYQALLAASTDVNVSFDTALDTTVTPGDPISFDVLVKDGASIQAVEGASVYAQLMAVSVATESESVTSAATTLWRELTDAAGIAGFSFSAPLDAGDYMLRVQVGASVLDTPITVNLPPELLVDTANMMVGTDSTQFRVRVLDNDGILVPGNTAIQLSTTIGHFELGATETTTVAVDGLYTSTLYAGTVSGTGTLRVDTPTGYATRQIVIDPDVAITITLQQMPGLRADLENLYLPFQTTLKDTYGNVVPDGTQVQVSSTVTVANDLIATASGLADFEIAVPHNYGEPVYVTAIITGTNISDTVEAINILPKLYIPGLVSP